LVTSNRYDPGERLAGRKATILLSVKVTTWSVSPSSFTTGVIVPKPVPVIVICLGVVVKSVVVEIITGPAGSASAGIKTEKAITAIATALPVALARLILMSNLLYRAG